VGGRKTKQRAWALTVDTYMRSHREWRDSRCIIAEAKNSSGKVLAAMKSCPSVFQLSQYFRQESRMDNPKYEVELMQKNSFTGGKHAVNFYRWIEQ
jgi:hypothetical protein